MSSSFLTLSFYLLFPLSIIATMYAFRLNASKSALKTVTRLASSGPAQVKRINVVEFDKILKSKENRTKYQIIDVREKDELALARIPGDDVVNLPLRDIDNWKSKVIEGDLLEQTKPTLVMCHHGVRSFRVATFLGELDFFCCSFF